MNLATVKYPNFVIKFKGREQREIEIMSGNMRQFKAARLDMVLPLLLRHVKQQQLVIRREDALARQEQQDAEEAALALMEIKAVRDIDDPYDVMNLSDA